jgi:adenylate kinase
MVPEVELIRRLASRMICDDCGANAPMEDKTGGDGLALRCARCGGRLVQRSDDNEAVVRERLKIFREQSEPLVEYYRMRPTFRSIDGAQTPDRVAEDLAAAIEAAGHRVVGAAHVTKAPRSGVRQ